MRSTVLLDTRLGHAPRMSEGGVRVEHELWAEAPRQERAYPWSASAVPKHARYASLHPTTRKPHAKFSAFSSANARPGIEALVAVP